MIGEVLLVRTPDLVDEDLGVEKVGIALAGTRFLPGFGEGVDRHPVPHFTDALEPARQDSSPACQGVGLGRAVEAGIDPHRGEQREAGVLGQHLGAGPGLGIGAAVDQALPPGVGPGGGAEVDRFGDGRAEALQLGRVHGEAGSAFRRGHAVRTLSATPRCGRPSQTRS